MNFDDSPEEARFRAEAYAWLEENADLRAPGEPAASFSERQDLTRVREAQAWQAKKFEAGWACINWPTEYGGRGGTGIERAIWDQEQAKFRLPPEVFIVGIGMAGPTLIEHGDEEQKARWLPRLAKGKDIWCQLFSEPAAGSDLASLRTRAERDGDDWVINGQKVWTSGGHYADWAMLIARTDFDAPKHAGLTYFVVDMKSPGIEVRQIRQITGDANFNEVFFTDLRIPDANRIAGIGEGWKVAMTTLSMERGAISMDSSGGVSFDDLLRLAARPGRDGQAAIDDGAVVEKIADIFTQSTALRFCGYRNLTTLSRGHALGPEAALVKLAAGRLRQDMGALGMELQGGVGALDGGEGSIQDGAWQYAYLYAPAIRIAGGTDEIIRNILAQRVLGLPAEARMDRGIAFNKLSLGE